MCQLVAETNVYVLPGGKANAQQFVLQKAVAELREEATGLRNKALAYDF
jgi:hypothetical protein